MRNKLLAISLLIFFAGCVNFYGGNSGSAGKAPDISGPDQIYFDWSSFEIYMNYTELNSTAVEVCGILEYTGEKAVRVYFGDRHPFTIHILDYSRDVELRAPLVRLDILTERIMKQGDSITWCRTFELLPGKFRAVVTAGIQVECVEKSESSESSKERCSRELRSDESIILINGSSR